MGALVTWPSLDKTETFATLAVVLAHALLVFWFIMRGEYLPPIQENHERVIIELLSAEATNEGGEPPASQPISPTPKKTSSEKSKRKEVATVPLPKAATDSSADRPQPSNAAQAPAANLIEPKKTASPPSQQQASSPVTTDSSADRPQPSNAAQAKAAAKNVRSPPIPVHISKLTVLYKPEAKAYYTLASKVSGEQGEVLVELIIDEEGNVSDVNLLRPSNYPRLDKAAIAIGKQYHFQPFSIDGVATSITTNFSIKFYLKSTQQ